MSFKGFVRHEYSFIAGILLLIILSIKHAFLPTYYLWKENGELKQRSMRMKSFTGQPGFLYREGKYVDSILSGYKGDTVNYGTLLMSRINQFADSCAVTITEVPDESNRFKSETMFFRVMQVEGQYANILTFINNVERAKGIGKLSSLTIRASKDETSPVNNKETLSADLVFEILKKSP